MDFTEKRSVAPGASAHRATPEPEPDSPRVDKPGAAGSLLGFLAIAGFLLFTEHRAHVFGLAPFALLALCPLLHLFHHSGHSGHGGHGGHGGSGTHRQPGSRS